MILENYGINYNSKKGRYNPVVVGVVVVIVFWGFFPPASRPATNSLKTQAGIIVY